MDPCPEPMSLHGRAATAGHHSPASATMARRVRPDSWSLHEVDKLESLGLPGRPGGGTTMQLIRQAHCGSRQGLGLRGPKPTVHSRGKQPWVMIRWPTQPVHDDTGVV